MEVEPALAPCALFAALMVLGGWAMLAPEAGAYCIPGACQGLTSAGDGISSSGPPVAVFGFGATSSSGTGDSLLSVGLELGGSGFSGSDLALLSTDGSVSGVALYRDDGAVDDALDAKDTPLGVRKCYWDGNTTVLTLDDGDEGVPAVLAGSFHWLLTVSAGTGMNDGDRVVATLRTGSIVLSGQKSMPASDLVAEGLLADSSPPGNWTILSPGDWVSDTQAPDVSVTVRDELCGLREGSASYSFSTDGGASWSDWFQACLTGPDGSTDAETVTAPAVGFHQDSADLNLIRFQIADRAGNPGESDELPVRIDTGGPGGWSGFEPSGWVSLSQSPGVTLDVSDLTSGLDTGEARYRFSTDGGATWSPWQEAMLSGDGGSTELQTLTAANVPFGQDSADRNLVMFRAADLAGNLAESGRYAVMIDTAAPGGWKGLEPAGWFTASQSPTVSVTVSDATSGLAAASALYSYSTDRGLNWSDWRAAGTDGEGRLHAAGVPFGQDSGYLNLIRFRVNDLAGNLADSPEYLVRIDTAGPADWTAMEPGGWWSGSPCPTVSIGVRDATSGVATAAAWYRFSTDGGSTWSGWEEAFMDEADPTTGYRTVIATDVPFGVDSGDRNIVEFMADDLAGNIGYSGGMCVRVDTTGPGSWIGFSPTGWTADSKAPTARVVVRDSVSGLRAGSARYRYSVDGGETFSGWMMATLSCPDGTTAFQTVEARKVPFGRDSGTLNRIQFLVCDVAGNEAQSPEYTVRIDTAPPGPWTGLAPGGWYARSRSPTVTVRVLDDVSGVLETSAAYQFSIDGGLTWSGWLPATVEWGQDPAGFRTVRAEAVPFGQDSAQLNKIRFRLSDIAGNLGSSGTYTIEIDTTPPGSWEAREASGWQNRPDLITFTVRCRDDCSGILPGSAGFQLSTDGGRSWSAWAEATIEEAIWAGAWNVTACCAIPGDAGGGFFLVRFRVGDRAGNVGSSEEFIMRVDSSPPGGWAGPFPAGWYGSTRSPAVSVQVADPVSGLDLRGAEYQYSTDGGATWSAWRPATLSGWSGSTEPQTLTAPGVPFDRDSGTLNRIQFRCRDIAGNVGQSGEYVVLIDTTAPMAYLRTLSAWTPSRSVALTVEAGDTVSSVRTVEVWYRLDGGDLALYATLEGASALTFAAPADGRYEFFLRATDAAGNVRALPSRPDASTTVDTAAPALEAYVELQDGGLSARVFGTTEPGAALRVNGRMVEPDRSGGFAVTVILPPGRSTVTVAATDAAGNTATVSRGVVGVEPGAGSLEWAFLGGAALGSAAAVGLVLLWRGRKGSGRRG